MKEPATAEPRPAPAATATPALPKVEGLAPAAGGRRRRRRRTSGLLTAVVAGATLGFVMIVAGWAVTEQSEIAEGRSLSQISLYIATLGVIYATVISAWTDLTSRIWDRALVRAAVGSLVGLIAGAASGALAHILFVTLQDSLPDPTEPRFYLLRALAWSVFGLGIGIASGIAERSGRKAANGAIGGIVGGALGGAVFQYLALNIDSESDARLLSLVAIGIFIGAAIRLVEIARRQAWLRVIAGGMAGKEFILYHASTQIGTSPKCQITLVKDQAAAPIHLRIDDHGNRRLMTSYDGTVTFVNGARSQSRTLRSGDLIQVGSTTLEYQEREAA